VKKKAEIRWKEPTSCRTPASHERCERGKGRKKEDSVVREVRSRQNKVSEDMSDSYVLTSFAVLSPSFGSYGSRGCRDVRREPGVIVHGRLLVQVPVENYFESRYYIELRKAHNLFEWLVSRDTEAGRRSYS
jgi:hypothetical protein